jgi:hypothetical protein
MRSCIICTVVNSKRNQIKENEMADVCVEHGGDEKRIQNFSRKNRRPLGGPRRRWENNIKIDIKDIGYEGVNWIHLVQERGPVAGSSEQDNGPSNSIKGGEILE